MSEPIDFPGPAYRNECYDPVVQRVLNKLIQRSNTGLLKYNTGLYRDDLTKKQWLIHLQEELMDAINYLQKMIDCEDGSKLTDPINTDKLTKLQ